MTPIIPDQTQSRYAQARAATRRARMLFGGVKPLNSDKSLNPCMNAVREMRAGLVPFTIVRKGFAFTQSAARWEDSCTY